MMIGGFLARGKDVLLKDRERESCAQMRKHCMTLDLGLDSAQKEINFSVREPIFQSHWDRDAA